MVQNVERVRSELKIDPFCDWRALGKREIDVLESRRREDVAPCTAESADVAHEGALVDPLRRIRIAGEQRLADHVIRAIERFERSARSGRLQRDDGAERGVLLLWLRTRRQGRIL